MIIITGASRGIGQFLLKSFVDQTNEEVIGFYMNTKPKDHDEKYVQIDITDLSQVESFINDRENVLKDITLINCAGITYNSFTHKSEPEQWRKVIDTNLIGTYNIIRSLLPIMRTQKFGRIINFSSVVAVKPTPGISSYAASKAALWGLSKSLAIENAALNITVNCINLGYSELGMIEMVPEEFKNNIISQVPAGILCPPEDILRTVNYLRTTQYITGSSIDLNGGLT
ncbi:SDR family NAD(P)-dependent oxidoreductase [Chryseobacterium sp. cx-311]|uniref:SDR family NAD(P)-dependent oxidoreductase n=1 Tax=Marnyiella aurantia TaxID=2758037 RepID=UPI001AE72E5E|nr:SDR family NAD(P)-dependent oxidoreductase [Marnyiella aurantia]MBP0612941.1 SDR family NAD(P)-dependent oxidoreductase [Marnyiella aurantia]